MPIRAREIVGRAFVEGSTQSLGAVVVLLGGVDIDVQVRACFVSHCLHPGPGGKINLFENINCC